MPNVKYTLGVSVGSLFARLREPAPVLARLASTPGLYLVGGYLRDAYLGLETQDVDLAVPAPLGPVLAELARALGAPSFELNRRFASHRIVTGGYTVDIAPLEEGSISEDLLRRDYTVNALAVPTASLGSDLGVDDLVAHPQAWDDLGSRTLRMIASENLAADPVRILRGYRLAATRSMTPDAATRQAWRELCAKVTESAGERLHEELLGWFGADEGPGEPLSWCADDGVLWELFPPLVDTVDCEQNDYHHLPVWAHTLESLNQLERLRRELPPELAQWEQELAEAWHEPVGGATMAGTLTRLALLFHDVGKPATREVQPDGRVSFHQHQDVGVELMSPVLERLKFSADESEFIELMLREHLRLGFYSDFDPLSPKLVYRFTRRLGAATPMAVLHGLADCAATRGPANAGNWELHVRAAAVILKHYFARDVVAAPPVLLDGHAIMALLGVAPGPVVGQLKDALLEATAAGEIETVAEAESFVRELHGSLEWERRES